MRFKDLCTGIPQNSIPDAKRREFCKAIKLGNYWSCTRTFWDFHGDKKHLQK